MSRPMDYEGTVRIRRQVDHHRALSYHVVFSPYRNWERPFPSWRVGSGKGLVDLLTRMGLPKPIVVQARRALSTRKADQAHWVTVAADQWKMKPQSAGCTDLFLDTGNSM